GSPASNSAATRASGSRASSDSQSARLGIPLIASIAWVGYRVAQAPVRIAADIGGTFTDVVLQRGRERWTRKLLTTHDALERVVPEIREARIESLAIGFLHSYANDAHERRAGEILARALPGVPITLSSAVCPEIREYERFSTAAANAYVRPLMSKYLASLETEMRRRGMKCPLYLMTSGGGLTTIEAARLYPVRLIESGPAGGAILSAGIARDTGEEEVLSFDMGGTTAKICFISQGRPEQSRRFEVARIWRNLKGSGLPLRIPV